LGVRTESRESGSESLLEDFSISEICEREMADERPLWLAGQRGFEPRCVEIWQDANERSDDAQRPMR